MNKIDEMTKYKLIAIFLIVLVTVLFIYLIILLFKVNKEEEDMTVTPQITPQVDTDLHDEFMKEFNESTDRIGHTYTLSTGQRITIMIPRGVAPPQLEVVEEMYRNRQN